MPSIRNIRRATVTAAILVFLTAGLLAAPACSVAGERPFRLSPYGEAKGGYGEKKAVRSAPEARRIIREYFGGKDVRIGEIREREWHYEAEIRDRHNKLVDRVIVDKRTGRIRSVY